MQARKLGLLLQSVYTGAQYHRTNRRNDTDRTPYINASFRNLQDLFRGGERDIGTLCQAVLEGTGITFAAVDADYTLIGDDHTYSDNDVDQVIDALVLASDRHRGQSRKDAAKTPYIIHPIEVLHIVFQIGGVRDLVTILACILHDTVEDVGVTYEELTQAYGADVSSVVQEVTDDKSLAKAERKRLQVEHAAHKSGRAKNLKYGDKCANIADVTKAEDWSATRMREYVEWGGSILRQFKGHNPRLDAYFESVSAAALTLIEQSGK